MQTRYEIRTKDGESHYINGTIKFIKFFISNIRNMYYFRINFN